MTVETTRDADLVVTDALDPKAQSVVDFVTADALTRQPAVAVGGHLLRSTMSGTLEAKQEALGALEGRFLIRYGEPPDEDFYGPTPEGALVSSSAPDIRMVLAALYELLKARHAEDPSFRAFSFVQLGAYLRPFRVPPSQADEFINRILALFAAASATDRFDGSFAWRRPARTEELVELGSVESFIKVLRARKRAEGVSADDAPKEPPRSDLHQYLPSELRERFSVIDQLGRGSYGTVFQVVDRESLQRFALKVTIAAPDAMSRAGREVEAVASLAHENILPAIDYEALGAWFILPLADGSLGHMRTWGRAGPGTALEIALSVGRALEHAHGLGFLHRDLHVDNILRCDGKWVVGDWGLAVGPRSDPLTRTRSVGGTETWTAPEQLASLRSADVRSDLFSLGRIVQWLLTGALPDISRAASLPVGEPLAAFVNACTQLSPAARPATVRAAMDLLPRQAVELAAPVAPAVSRASPRPLRASVPPATLGRVLETHRARLAQIQGGQTPVAIERRPMFVLHVLPVDDTGNFDLLPLKAASVDLMPPVAHVHWHVRFNHDGLLGCWPDEAPVSQYVQVLRTGGIELVDTYGVQRIHAPNPVLFPLSLERDVVAFIRHWNETILGPLGVSLPRVACLSVTGIKGFVLHIDERPSFLPKPLFDRDTVSFRPVVLDAAEDVEQSLKPTFDALWQAAGEDRSLGYSSAGSWIPDAHKRA